MLTLDRPPAADLRPLRAHTTGDVVVPGERVWGEVLAALDLPDGGAPAAVVFPANDYDVAAVRSFVRYVGLQAAEAGDDLPGDLARTVVVMEPGTPPPWRFRR